MTAETDTPVRVVVASGNPVKCRAVAGAWQAVFPATPSGVTGVAVDSGVGAQPMTDEATRTGAANRARAAKVRIPDAHYWIGIEGGVAWSDGNLEAFAWVAVIGPGGRLSESRTGTFAVPPKVAALIRQGYELGDADDIVFSMTDSKRVMGAVGILTDGVIARDAYYEHAVILALIPYVHPELYPPVSGGPAGGTVQ